MFEAADYDESGSIDKEEFENIVVILCAQILSRMIVYYGVLILFVPWLSRQVIDATPQIHDGSYLEMAAEQTMSVSIFFVAIPLLWNVIDSSAHNVIDKINQGRKMKNE